MLKISSCVRFVCLFVVVFLVSCPSGTTFLTIHSVDALSGAYTYDELKEYFNFGLADIDTDGNLTFSIVTNSNEVGVRKTTFFPLQIIYMYIK